MATYDHLLGLTFDEQNQHCYSLVRSFYKDVFGIELRDYANPHRWWDYGENLFLDNFRREGFRLLDCPPHEYQFGDVLIMAINSTVGNHSAVLVDSNRILHHLVGQRSCVHPYGGLFRNTTVAVLRHPDVAIPVATLDLVSLLPRHVANRIEELKNPQQSSSSEADPGT